MGEWNCPVHVGTIIKILIPVKDGKLFGHTPLLSSQE
jgi:hypothetical protein